jgi:hypothetical protein
MKHYFITFTLESGRVNSDIVTSATDFDTYAGLRAFIADSKKKNTYFQLLSWKLLND